MLNQGVHFMEKLIKNIKKLISWKTPSLITYLVLISVVLLYTFKSEIVPYFYRIKFSSPVIFHNLRITFPKGIIYNEDKKSIVFHHWEDPNTFLIVGMMNLNKLTKERLILFFKEKNFFILETKEISFFKGYPGFTISYIDTSWKYNKAVYVIPKNLRITYQGTKDNYEDFKQIIDSIEFL
jgi:hypothetical protein